MNKETPTFADPYKDITDQSQRHMISDKFVDDEPPVTVKELFKDMPDPKLKDTVTDSVLKHGGGKKFDTEKVRTDLLNPIAIMATADVLTFGAKKYGDRNWEKGMKWSRVYGACLRHLFAFWSGEDMDPESGLPHLDHAAACIHFLQTYTRCEDFVDGDDRTFLGYGE